MSQNPKYKYKRLEDEHLADVQYILLEVFNKRVSLEYLENKYNTSLIGLKYICTIAYDGEKPIAFYGAIPQKFSTGTSTFFAAHACDSFTLAGYQKQGLHYNLALKAYEIMKANQVKFVYAFHSVNTYYSTKKLGWKEHVRMKRFHIAIPVLPISKIANKLHLQKSYHKITNKYLKQYVSEKSLESSEFKNRIGNCYDDNFLTYKNGFNNHFFIDINTCTFWIKIDAIMHVGFFSAPSSKNFKTAIQKLKKIAFILGINEILFQVSPDSEMYQLLIGISKPKESWLIGYLPFDDSVNINDLEFSYADLDTF